MKSFNEWLNETTSGEIFKPKRGKVIQWEIENYA
jgi:hypothetical protein